MLHYFAVCPIRLEHIFLYWAATGLAKTLMMTLPI